MLYYRKIDKLLLVLLCMVVSGALLTYSDEANSANNEPVKIVEQIPLPEGVTIVKVLEDVTLHHKLQKREELLSDGGKRVMITRNNGTVIVYYIEYEGLITAVNGRQLTVQVEYGATQTITIPDHIIIEDDDQLGLKPGVHIEWEIDRLGQIISAELDD